MLVGFTSSSLASLCSIPPLYRCFLLLLLLAPMGAVERIVEFSTHPQAVQEKHRKLSP